MRFKKIHQCFSSHFSLCRHFESISSLLLSEVFSLARRIMLFFQTGRVGGSVFFGVGQGPFYNRPGEDGGKS